MIEILKIHLRLGTSITCPSSGEASFFKLKYFIQFLGKGSNPKEKDVSFAAEVKLKGNILRCNSLLRLLNELKEQADITEMMVGTVSNILASPTLVLGQRKVLLWGERNQTFVVSTKYANLVIIIIIFFIITRHLCEIFVELFTGKNNDFNWHRRERNKMKNLSRCEYDHYEDTDVLLIYKVRTFHLFRFWVGFYKDRVVSFNPLFTINILWSCILHLIKWRLLMSLNRILESCHVFFLCLNYKQMIVIYNGRRGNCIIEVLGIPSINQITFRW